MTENEIAKQILDAAFAVHTKLGPGLSNPCMRLYSLTNCKNEA